MVDDVQEWEVETGEDNLQVQNCHKEEEEEEQ
jgi:hypothetical protein